MEHPTVRALRLRLEGLSPEQIVAAYAKSPFLRAHMDRTIGDLRKSKDKTLAHELATIRPLLHPDLANAIEK